MAGDVSGEDNKLIPVRVLPCKPEGLLKTRIYIDLADIKEAEQANQILLKEFAENYNIYYQLEKSIAEINESYGHLDESERDYDPYFYFSFDFALYARDRLKEMRELLINARIALTHNYPLSQGTGGFNCPGLNVSAFLRAHSSA